MEPIECPLCFQVFNSDTVLLHCFYCGHVACLSCIRRLTRLGCYVNCRLPQNLRIPLLLNVRIITSLNCTLIRRVYMDFTNMADVRMNLTQREEELAQVREERIYYKRLLDEERARNDHESHATLIRALTEKLYQLESRLKSFLTPVERVDAAVSADAVAPGPNPYTSWRSRGVQVNLSTPGASILFQDESHYHTVAAGPSIMNAQQSTSSSVAASNSQTASSSTQPQGNAHGNSSPQLDVSEPSSSDSEPQSEPSTRNSTPSPVLLRPMTNAERAYLIGGDPQEPDAGSSSTGPQAPQLPPAFQFNPDPAAQSGASSPVPHLDPPMFVFTAGASAQGTRSRHQGRGGGSWNPSTYNRR